MMSKHQDWIRSVLRLLSLVWLQGILCAQGTLTFVPTDREQPAELQKTLNAIGGKDATHFVLALTEATDLKGVDHCIAPEDFAGANDRALCKAILEADVLVLRGGTFIGWYKTVYPSGMKTHLASALREYLRSQRPLIAYGGATEFLSGGVALPVAELEAGLDERKRNPHDKDEHKARVALPVGPNALFDSEDWEAGAPLRILRALWKTHADLGFLFVGPVALEFSRQTNTAQVLGGGQILIFDLRKARRGKGYADGVRAHLLAEGDGWNFGTHSATFVDLTTRKESKTRHKDRAEVHRRVDPKSSEQKIGALEFADWVREQAREHALERRWLALEVEWNLSWDAGSAVWSAADQISVLGVPLSCRWMQH
ncbi:MAG: hypothetical protein ACI8X5_002498 [Planctomycetota bacterium]|jgi:hypothetical protein